MLLELDIRDFALIADIQFRPESGFVVLTGETGAGKSILIGALAQLSGDRADTSLVRSGAEAAYLSALVTDQDGTESILGRDIMAAGRTVARLDGRMVPLSQLRERGQQLIAIHGQREGQRIFDEETHRPLLDRFCQSRLTDPLTAYEATRQRWLADRKTLRSFGRDPAARARRMDVLTHQIDEIRQAELIPGEEEKLREKSRLQKTLSKVYGDLAEALAALADSEASAADQLAVVKDRLQGGAKASKTLAALRERVEETMALVDGITHDLRRFFDRIDLDPAIIAETDARLDEYGKLKYKYGNTVADVLRHLETSETELKRLAAAGHSIEALEASLRQADLELRRQALVLHRIRSEEATRVAALIMASLKDLDMTKVRFDVEVSAWAGDELDWSVMEGGTDRVRFLISANLGEPLMPLARIASGGEASRVLLAIKSILAELDDLPVLVFDEIDTGISGHTAQLVGEKLKALGRSRHVFCVTHSAAVAASADHHYLIEKREINARTETGLRKLEGERRVSEIARLLSGRQDDAKTLALAAAMLGVPSGSAQNTKMKAID